MFGIGEVSYIPMGFRATLTRVGGRRRICSALIALGLLFGLVNSASAYTTLHNAEFNEKVASQPTLVRSGEGLAWDAIDPSSWYVLRRKLTGHPLEYALVKGTAATPPSIAGTTVTYAVRAALGNNWSVEKSLSYAQVGAAFAEVAQSNASQVIAESSFFVKPEGEPTPSFSGAVLGWNATDPTGAYVLRRQVPGRKAELALVKAVAVKPPEFAGMTVGYSVRSALEVGWASEITKSYPLPEEPEEPPVEEPTAFRFFAASSLWNAPLSASAPLDSTSAALMSAFNKVVVKEGPKNELNINTTAWSVPIYTVPAGQPTVKVLVNKPNSSRYAIQAAWSAVPLPPGAQPAQGSDKTLAVWQPSTDKLWEFWNFERNATGAMAKWGGAMEKVSTAPGFYNESVWPGAKPQWGSSASSLAIVGGLITLEDLARGRIDHALAIAVPNPRAVVYASPAQRTDGTSTSPVSLPEGAHMRLDPKLDLSTLHLPHLILMMAEAAQRYGIVVRDRSANVTFYAQDPTPTKTNPYLGAQGYYEGRCQCKLLEEFPWSHLQLLKMELRSVP